MHHAPARLPALSPPASLQYLGDLGADYVVFKNDEKTVAEIRAMNPAGILVSPGPGGAGWIGAHAARPPLPSWLQLHAWPNGADAGVPARPAGRPEDSGISLEAVRELGPDFPLFGVCMGHQCIGQAFGGEAAPLGKGGRARGGEAVMPRVAGRGLGCPDASSLPPHPGTTALRLPLQGMWCELLAA